MIPTVQNDILIANPKFSALYQDLCGNKLQQDGTSKPDNKLTQEHDQLQKVSLDLRYGVTDLHKARTEAYKREIIRNGLQDIAYRGEALPDELRDLVLLVAATLGGEIASDDLSVVEAELARLQCHAPDIAALLSKRLAEHVSTLSAVTSVADDSNVAWPDAVTRLISDATSQQELMRRSRSALADGFQELHNVRLQVLETSVKILEQILHGGVARHSKAKSEYLALVADGISKKLSMQHAQLAQQIYSSEMQETIRSTLDSTREESNDVRSRVRSAEETLTQYRSARGMDSMIKGYAELLAETQRVENEIIRLKGGM